MRVSASVDITTFIEDGAIEINPMVSTFDTGDHLRTYIDNRRIMNGDKSYLYLPESTFGKSINLLEYNEIWDFDYSKLLKYSQKPKATELETIRIYCQSEFLEYIVILDLKYKNCNGVYRLSEIRLWDDMPTTETFTYDFKLQAVDSQVLRTTTLKLDLFKKALDHKTTVIGGQNEHTIEYL